MPQGAVLREECFCARCCPRERAARWDMVKRAFLNNVKGGGRGLGEAGAVKECWEDACC